MVEHSVIIKPNNTVKIQKISQVRNIQKILKPSNETQMIFHTKALELNL